MSTRTPYEDLADSLSPLTSQDDVHVKEDEISVGVRRITLTRHLPGGSSRYIQFRHAPPDPGTELGFPVYAALYGAYGNADVASNFDARSLGDLATMIELARQFIVDLVAPSTLPRFNARS